MSPAPAPITGRATGYHLLAADGGMFSFGPVAFPGTPNETVGGRRWAALASCPRREGLVAVASDGSVAFLAGAVAPDDMGSGIAGAPAIDIQMTPRGHGFWVLDAAGGVFSFGGAPYFGSIPGLGGTVKTAPIVAMASSSTGSGYWILDQAGGVFSFGDAEYHGSVPALGLNEARAPAVDFAVTATGEGYAVLEADGVIRSFGDAVDAGPVRTARDVTAVAFASTSPTASYVVVDGRGFVFPVGDAPMFGSAADLRLAAPVVDVAVSYEPDDSAA